VGGIFLPNPLVSRHFSLVVLRCATVAQQSKTSNSIENENQPPTGIQK
jgi:hypothetical protein